ncbi:MAG: bifunctional 5,10-methylenetetrahydrofolate dehydrogenase/5,10-methenyltetrahydrofolate cyclohydrolase [Candidatus ainarchaeum sp.]|nr:bifunctional 5,10-methylenetetrahydrofolate dehydrogenase/5,10-methenyltetrahydrofolate cyclohydrolase [Candidatus ainarchaeum sp.]
MILDGKKVSEKILTDLKKRIIEKKLAPKLVIITIGKDDASEVYVRKKLESAEKIGITAKQIKFTEESSEQEILNEIDKLNKDKNVDGFIVQLPVPKHINANKLLEKIAPEKDVDGFHPINVGKLFLGISEDNDMLPATPFGIMKMIEYYKIKVEGKNAVVVGRSNIVGKPIASLLLNKNATVSITHSKTKNLEEYTKKADIIVVAVGKPKIITAEMVKEGAYIIDVGMNKINGKNVGDVDFENVIKKAHCSPVPGGVGPLTVAMLMYNTVKASEK